MPKVKDWVCRSPSCSAEPATVTSRCCGRWPAATPKKDIDEALRVIEERRHSDFKLKIGARPLAEDIQHVAAIKKAIGGRASIRVDVNQAWDEMTAVRGLAAVAGGHDAAGAISPFCLGLDAATQIVLALCISEESPMNIGKTLFARLMDFLPWSTFARIVARYGGRRFAALSNTE